MIAGVVTYAAERSFLVSRVDQVFNATTLNNFEDYLDQQLGLRPAGRQPGGLSEASAGPRPNGGPPCTQGGGRAAGRHSCCRPSAPTASTSAPAAGATYLEFAGSGEPPPSLPHSDP